MNIRDKDNSIKLKCIRVERDFILHTDTHISESEYKSIHTDFTLFNNSTKEDLYNILYYFYMKKA